MEGSAPASQKSLFMSANVSFLRKTLAPTQWTPELSLLVSLFQKGSMRQWKEPIIWDQQDHNPHFWVFTEQHSHPHSSTLTAASYTMDDQLSFLWTVFHVSVLDTVYFLLATLDLIHLLCPLNTVGVKAHTNGATKTINLLQVDGGSYFKTASLPTSLSIPSCQFH
jgi:hypothetical protein